MKPIAFRQNPAFVTVTDAVGLAFEHLRANAIVWVLPVLAYAIVSGGLWTLLSRVLPQARIDCVRTRDGTAKAVHDRNDVPQLRNEIRTAGEADLARGYRLVVTARDLADHSKADCVGGALFAAWTFRHSASL